MIDFRVTAGLGTLDLGAPARKPTSIDCQQWEAARELWRSNDGTMKIGVWECTPGRFSADRAAASETCHLISGRVTLHNPDGTSRDLAAGDMLVCHAAGAANGRSTRRRGNSTSSTPTASRTESLRSLRACRPRGGAGTGLSADRNASRERRAHRDSTPTAILGSAVLSPDKALFTAGMILSPHSSICLTMVFWSKSPSCVWTAI